MAVVQGGTYSLLGINAEDIPMMQQAIKEYKEGIVTPLDDLVTQSDYTSAFKGSIVAEKIGGYIGTVIEKLKQMIDVIDDFDASLTQVQINYEDQAGKIASDVVSDAESIEGKLPETTPGVQGYTPTHGPGTSSDGQTGDTDPGHEPAPASEDAGDGDVPDGGNPDGDTSEDPGDDTQETPDDEQPVIPGGGGPGGGGSDDGPGKDPENPGEEDPENPGGEDPENPGGEDPENPGGEDPENPGGEDPENPGGEDPENPGGEDPENPGGEDPENPGGEDPENPGGEDPENPGDIPVVTEVGTVVEETIEYY